MKQIIPADIIAALENPTPELLALETLWANALRTSSAFALHEVERCIEIYLGLDGWYPCVSRTLKIRLLKALI